MAYASQAQFKEYQGVDTTDDDDLIDRLLDTAQAAVDSYCRRTFEASADSTRYFTDYDGDRLWLDKDLAALTSVTNGDGNAVASSNYRTEPRNAVADGVPIYAIALKSSSTVAWDTANDTEIAVAGRWAYSVTAPADIVQATLRLASYLYRQKDNSGDLDRPVLVSASTTILPAQLPKDIKTMLDPYRRKHVTA